MARQGHTNLEYKASEKLKHLDGRGHEEQGTADDVEQQEPVAKGNQRTHHRGWRIRGMEW